MKNGQNGKKAGSLENLGFQFPNLDAYCHNRMVVWRLAEQAEGGLVQLLGGFGGKCVYLSRVGLYSTSAMPKK